MTEQECIAKMIAPGQKRATKWRGGVIQIHVTRACDLSCYGCTQGSNLVGKPSFITVEQFEEAVVSLSGYYGVYGVFGGNPSCRRGTKVFTTDGIFPIEELEGKVFNVRNLNGQISPAFCRLSGKDKPLYKITLRGGHEYYATAEHQWPALELMYGPNHKDKNKPNYSTRKIAIPLGKITTDCLKPGMRLPINRSDSMNFGTEGTIEDGFLAGWLLGDGWIVDRGVKKETTLRDGIAFNAQLNKDGSLNKRNFTKKSTKIRSIGLIVNQDDMESGIADGLTKVIKRLGSKSSWRAAEKCHELTACSHGIDQWMDHFGILGKSHGLPLSVWSTASEHFRIGLIDGLFSSDGTVEVSKNRGFARIRLTTAHKKLATDVSDLLGFYGIKTSITSRTREGRFPNKKDYKKVYTSHDVCISGTADVEHFAKLFRLTHDKKRQRLEDSIGNHKADVENNNIEIVSVEETSLREDVWDVSVGDDTHCFQLAHCITGNCTHPKFDQLCTILRKHVPQEQCGLWCNHPRGWGTEMRETFNPRYSNLNVHLSKTAYDAFKRDWPESMPFGLKEDSRHSPPFVAMKDLLHITCDNCGGNGGYYDTGKAHYLSDPEDGTPWRKCSDCEGTGGVYNESLGWELISNCDINQHWSAMMGVFRGELRAWFCEIAGAQSILHQEEKDYPDTGIIPLPGWWRRPMTEFADQVRKHCHDCGVPLRGYGEMSQAADGPDVANKEQVTESHALIYHPKRPSRRVEVVTNLEQLGIGKLQKMTDYLGNGRK